MSPPATSRAQPILITGASGLLGGALVRAALSQNKPVTALSHTSDANHSGVENMKTDLTQTESVFKLLDRMRPSLIIHSAAATDVERCEREPEWAERLNVQTTADLAQWAKNNDSFLVYISTDSVFDGARGDYREEETPRPLNVYAKTKLLGEEAVQSKTAAHLIIRTNFYGWSTGKKESLAEWILRGLAAREPLKTFIDVRFAPLFTQDLAKLIFELLALKAAGVFHLAAKDAVSKHDFALRLSRAFQLPETLVPISVDHFAFKAPRGKNMVLNTGKATQLLKRAMPSVDEGIASFKENAWCALS